MCGIYGSTKLYSEDIISEKLDIAKFRGPDFSRYKHFSEQLVLGHNRLSILDLDQRSNQPFEYDDIAVVFNGEIYNFEKLRKSLIDKGYIFKTTSDTEVLCAMYVEYGNKCVEYFIGMFAFALYDKKNNLLFGARDRLGQKPFFYYLDGDHFEFASNLRQIKLANALNLDKKMCANYFYFGYFTDPETPFENVKKLMPGHSFCYDLSTSSLTISRYWDIDNFTKNKYGSYKLAKKELEETLRDAIKIRLRADVPVGLFLSGGIDSSLISALAKQVKTEINTYSIKFNEKKFDESSEAQEIAKHLGTNHHTFVCSIEKSKDLICSFYKYYDEPFADVSALPSMLLSSEVKKDVTVALTGDGADEFFIGYSRYTWMQKIKPFYQIPYTLRRLIAIVIGILPNYKIKMLAKGFALKNLELLYFRLMSSFKTGYVTIPNSFNTQKRLYSHFSKKSILEACSRYDIDVYLNSDINTKVDRASMAYSLETRSPFMDHRVVELSRRLPTFFKYRKRKSKYILKDILGDYVPKSLFERPKKGFGVPMEDWLKDDLKPMFDECYNLFKSYDFDFIDYSKFERLVNDFYKGRANNSVELWKMMMFVMWYREYEV